ncbi:hypothetical protein GGS20DRAFT_584685 [Poronia punctata]|nr:hypothetical protein GGS20DRAFT_584685 [Poronia punctata]
MPVFNQALVDGAQVVARAVEYQIRQAASTAVNSAISGSDVGAPTPVPTPTSALSSSISSPTSITPTSTVTQGQPDNPGSPMKDNTNSNSPLLFFVALGFGVVFTNLWIIVGVKYCFRYNARNRALARLDENGEPIDMQNMPARPHRRRREKKLMSMDEVNDKFPMMKYKTWVLERRRDGLPSAGGISAPPSRANSIRGVEVAERPNDARQSNEEQTRNADPTTDDETKQKPNESTSDNPGSAEADRNVSPNAVPPATSAHVEVVEGKDSNRRSSEEEEEEEEEEDQIGDSMDPDMVGSSGDTCAICIDTLEDNDDVRGLTCGHAFHAACLDPWLTNRRACCPLCKADYYTPKVRPQAAEGDPNDPNAPGAGTDPTRNNNRMNYPRTPGRSFAWSHFRDAPRQMFPSRFDRRVDLADANRTYRPRQRPERPSRHNDPNQTRAANTNDDNQGNIITRFRNRFPPFRLDHRIMRRGSAGVPADDGVDVSRTRTPSQLEAGSFRQFITRRN